MSQPNARHGSLPLTVVASFMGHAPHAYKWTILAMLAGNVALYFTFGPVVAAWAIMIEFIFTLAMALKCYPLAPGGLLALQAVLLGLTSPESVYEETGNGLPIILLLIFMVSAIAFMQELLVYVFTRALTLLRSRVALGLAFCLASALLSAFLDALTVIAVLLTVAYGFYRIYFSVVAAMPKPSDDDLAEDVHVPEAQRGELVAFRATLRSLLMHAAVGTALGGICTLVGEPQNLLIGHAMNWQFMEFLRETLPVSMPVLAAGLVLCALLEQFRWFGYGANLPEGVRTILLEHARHESLHRTQRDRWRLVVQAIAALLLVLALAMHWAEVGLIGLAVLIVLGALLGVSEEHRLADAMKTALPFTALLVVFFAIVAMIHDQQLFHPVINAVLALAGREQIGWMYLANGALSAISDNVFVASVYMDQLREAHDAGLVDAAQYARLAVAINAGTNIPSVATPNGQAAFLFLLTSSLAPMLRLSYARMCWMALPYFVVLTLTGLWAAVHWL